jgi:hypothetical protein
MRLWARATWQFILFAVSPLRRAESVWGWIEMGILLLAILGISITAIIGAVNEESRWLLTIVTPSLAAFLFFCAGIRLQYRLLRANFYLRLWNISYRLLSDPLDKNAYYKASTSFDLTISNQQDKPRGVSKFALGIKFQDGTEKELRPMKSDNATEDKIVLYLQPREPKTIRLNFVYDKRPISKSEILYVCDDRGAFCSLPVNIDTAIKMAKKSKSRSGDYLIE